MRFLIDANLPRSIVDEIVSAGYEAIHVRDIGLRDASDEVIAAHARREEMVIMSRDTDFGDVRSYPPRDYAGIVVLHLPETAVVTTIVTLVRQLITNTEVVEQLPGQLAIVECGRVRLRDG